MKKLLFFIICLFSLSLYSQNDTLKEQEQNVSDSLLIILDDSPSFPGGEKARIRFLKKNIEYPEQAIKEGIQGTVHVSFIVETDGSIDSVEILRGIGGGCDEEAVRVIKNMPKWKAGKYQGKNVRVQFNMPIKFTLEKVKNKKKRRKKETK